MFQIFESKYNVNKLFKCLENLRKKGYSNDVIDQILNTIVPNNKNYPIKLNIENRNDVMPPASFDYTSKTINIFSENLENYILKIINPTLKINSNMKKEDLFNNFVLHTLIHEVEHVYQHLIGNKYIEFPYQIIVEAYKDLTELKISKDTNPIYALMMIKNYFKQINKHGFLLERNANVESYDILYKVAKYENNSELQKFIKMQENTYLKYGYNGFYNGAIEESYKKTWQKSLYNALPKDEDIPIEDRVRYGLSIDKDTKEKVLKNKFNIN
ncbi:MAG: hypothetical protein IJO32_02910 [Bacilli bacterium]|nr:hypothetical protein [Bacilli bacterium]